MVAATGGRSTKLRRSARPTTTCNMLRNGSAAWQGRGGGKHKPVTRR